MINLLSPQEKKALIQERNWRLIMILGAVLASSLISLSLILLSIKIYISGELEAQTVLFEQKELEDSSIQKLEQELNLQNLTFSDLASFYKNSFQRGEILTKLSQKLVSGAYLTNTNISIITRQISKKEKETFIQVTLSGFCSERDSLLEFKDNLEKEPLFEQVDFPPSNWVQPNNIDFIVSFKIKPNESYQ